MANWKKVDADQLDADLTTVADAIRERSGTAEQMNFPDGFVSAVEGIQDLGEQLTDGTILYYRNETITKMRGGAFSNCSELAGIVIPKISAISGYAFQNCRQLTTVDCSAASIGVSAFQNCAKLDILIIRSATMATLENTNAFSDTPIKSGGTGHIYFPRALLSDTDATKDYRQATNWSTISSQFRALEDYTVDGTTTGEFDYTAAGYTKITLDGTQTISIPGFSNNPSGGNGCTHFEYVLPTSTNREYIIAPTFLRRAGDIASATYKGVSNIYHANAWNGNNYLVVSMDSNLLGTTVASVKEYLATNNLVFYVKV